MKQGSAFMEAAIEKASRLIELLSKQNEQIKSRHMSMQQVLDEEIAKRQKLESENSEYRQECIALREQSSNLHQQVKQMKSRIAELEQKLDDKITKNKQLHEKIAENATKLQSLTKGLDKAKKSNMSLQNQNEYLLRLMNQQKMKQNQFSNYCMDAESQFHRQLELLGRTKNAFSKKCEELRSENLMLRNQLTGRAANKVQPPTNQNQCINDPNQVKFLMLFKQCSDSLTEIIESILKVKAKQSLAEQIEQIKTFLSFRMQHLENLLTPIFEFCERELSRQKLTFGKMHVNMKDLQNLNSLVSRLYNYTSQIIKQ